MYSQQQVVNKPSTAYYLTLIGAILGLLGGAIAAMFLALTVILIPIGIWLIVANVLMISYAKRLMDQPEEHNKYGIYIIVLSILSGGNVLCLIGGILALVHQPTPTQPYAQPYQTYPPYTHPSTVQPAQYASTKYCPQCGNPVGAEAQFCPKCGKQLPP